MSRTSIGTHVRSLSPSFRTAECATPARCADPGCSACWLDTEAGRHSRGSAVNIAPGGRSDHA